MGSDDARRAWLAALVLTLGLAPACSSPQSFVVLDLDLAAEATGPITGISSVQVTVKQGMTMVKELTYSAPGLVIDAYEPGADGGASTSDGGVAKTLSVDFSSGVTGTVSFSVKAMADDCILGEGHTDATIRKGGIVERLVALTPEHICGPDGGSPDGGGDTGNTFPGCNVVSPESGPGTLCAAGQVCEVNCRDQKTDCVAGGAGAPGSICTTNADCAPGSQCFDYTTTGCAVKVCLKFCGGAADCAAFGAGGGGSGSVCEGLVPCGSTLTSYHTCTFNCDPTSAAAATHGGCPGSLICVMPASMDAVDCACPGTTRTKTEGQACTSASDCAPGLICNQMSGSKTCRPICRCNATGGACTPGAGTCPTAGTTCHPVTNDTLFGVCL